MHHATLLHFIIFGYPTHLHRYTRFHRLLDSNASIMTLSSIQRISDRRSLALEQKRIIHRCASNATESRHKQRDYKVKALCSKDFAAVDECRENSRCKVAGWVDSLRARSVNAASLSGRMQGQEEEEEKVEKLT